MTQKRKVLLLFLFSFCLTGTALFFSSANAGAKVTCSLKNGTLTIKGKGKIRPSLKIPNKKKIKKIVVKKGITSISAEVFTNMPKVREITVDKSVKYIENEAFYDCERLESITLPGKFKYDMEESVPLTFVDTISFNSPLDLKVARFMNTEAYVVSPDDPKYKSINGSIYTKNGRSLVCIPSYMEKMTTAPGCTDFHTDAPAGRTDITLSPDIETITSGPMLDLNDDLAYSRFFCRTDKLSAEHLFRLMEQFPFAIFRKEKYDPAQLPTTVKKEGDCYVMDGILFYYKGKASSFTIPQGIKKIAACAFMRNMKLKSVNIPEGVTHLGAHSFFECSRLKKVHLPESLTNLGYYCFASNPELNEANIPQRIKSIPDGAFYDSFPWHDNSLVIPDSVETIGDHAFYSSTANPVLSLTLGKNVRRIEDGAFYGNFIKRLRLPKKLTYIGSNAFQCSDLKALTIPANVKTIEEDAFGFGTKAKITILRNPKHYSIKAFSAIKYNYKKGVRNAFTNLFDWKYIKYTKPDKSLVKIKWGKISGVSGYEIKVSTDSKMKKNVSKKTIRKNITSTTITVKAKGGKHKMTCKIRPYKIKNGKKIYGRWSRDKLD